MERTMSLALEDNLPNSPTSNLHDALDKEEAQHIHGENCWSWGPTHYACACAEIAKLNGWAK